MKIQNHNLTQTDRKQSYLLVARQLEIFNMQHFIADAVEKVLIVGYDEKRLLPSGEIIIKPYDRVQI
jgi:hypothetical protein